MKAMIKRGWSQRLRLMYRSAGWPMQDDLELELLAAGLLERVHTPDEAERLRLSDLGVAAAVQGMANNRAARSAHEILVGEVAALQQARGRIAWRGLSLRVNVREAFDKLLALSSQPEAAEPVANAPSLIEKAQHTPPRAPKAKWVTAMPDVFSVRHTSVEAYLQAAVHEIKVHRADVLGEIRKPLKTAAYCQMASEVWWVLGCDGKGRPVADASEAPQEVGVMQAWPAETSPDLVPKAFRFEMLRQAPHRRHTMSFPQWMALARAVPTVQQADSTQAMLQAAQRDGVNE